MRGTPSAGSAANLAASAAGSALTVPASSVTAAAATRPSTTSAPTVRGGSPRGARSPLPGGFAIGGGGPSAGPPASAGSCWLTTNRPAISRSSSCWSRNAFSATAVTTPTTRPTASEQREQRRDQPRAQRAQHAQPGSAAGLSTYPAPRMVWIIGGRPASIFLRR